MTNTIPNVPRELLERCAQYTPTLEKQEGRARALSELRAILSAPSPAGVDGLETALSSEQILEVFERNGFRIELGASFSARGQIAQLLNAVGEIERLSDAQAIIEGLRGENEALHAQVKVLQSDANSWQSGYDEGRRMGGKHCALTIDQQAQRIGELEGLLRHAQKQVPTGSGLHMRIDTAMSAGKEGE